MTRFRRYDVVDRTTPSFYHHNETSIFAPRSSLSLSHGYPSLSSSILEDDLAIDCALDLLEFSDFDSAAGAAFSDLIQIDETTPFHTSYRRHSRHLGFGAGGDLYLQNLCDRVSDLELGFDRLVRERAMRRRTIGDGKYTWTADVKGWEGDHRRYKLTAEIKDRKFGRNNNNNKVVLDERYNWIKDRKGVRYSPVDYRIKAGSHGYSSSSGSGSSGSSSSSSSGSDSEKEKDKKHKKYKIKKKKKGEKVIKDHKGKLGRSNARIVEIRDPSDHGAAMYLRQVSVINHNVIEY